MLDGWRRIRLRLPSVTELPPLDAVVNVKRYDRSAVITVRGYSSSIPESYRIAGAAIESIETMSLEEIFMARYEAGTA